MGARPAGRLSTLTILRLGRVSNLPTVWTNALAGAALAHAAGVSAGMVLGTGLALTLFYTGGMWLNDAFDAEVDAVERATRPIPAGEIGRGTVFWGGAALLALGTALTFGFDLAAGAAGLALAATVLLYDWLHKRTSLSPVIMGLTRSLCYVLAALAAGGLNTAVLAGAAGLFCHIVGLTYAAKQEAYDRLDRAWPLGVLALPLLVALGFALMADAWLPFALCLALAAAMALALRRLTRRSKGDVPAAVITLIAAISLYDAVLIAAAGFPLLALLAVAGFGLTLMLQRVVPGT